LLDRVGETRHVVIDEASTHAKRRFVMQNIVRQVEPCIGFPREVAPAGKSGAQPAAIRPDFADVEHQLVVAIDDVPRVRVELMLDLSRESRPTENDDARLAPQYDAEQ